MFIYGICTQYLVEDPSALITASIRRGMEVICWHCWGGMKTRFLWPWSSAHLHFLVSCFSFSSWQYSTDSLCSGLVCLLASQAQQHLGHLTNFLWTCLDTALCEQLLWQWMFVSYPPCEGCQWLSSGQLSDQQSSSWLCRLVNQTERPFWRLRKPLQVFGVD